MLWGYDRIRRVEVHADDAVSAPNRYICPNPPCGARVHLCAGDYKRAYFAHTRGQGNLDCDDYHPGLYVGPTATPNYQEDERTQDERLGLELHVRGRRWSLKLRIPKSPAGGTGRLTIRRGPGAAALTQVSVETLRNAAVALDLIPCYERLGVIGLSNDVPSSYRDTLNPATFQFEENQMLVFHASGFGRFKSVGSKLYWGSSYYFVWPQAHDASLSNVTIKDKLLDAHNWRCALVELPQEASTAIHRSITRQTSLAVGSRRAHISVIFPTTWRRSAYGEIEAEKSGSQIVVAVDRLGAELLTERLTVESHSGLTSANCGGTERLLVSQEIGAGSEPCFFVRYGSEPGTLISLKSAQTKISTLARLSAVDSDGSRVSAPFLSRRAYQLLSRYRAGNMRSISVKSRTPLSGRIKWRTQAQSTWQELNIDFQPVDELKYWPLKLPALNHLMRDKSLEIVIDLGVLGYHHWPPTLTHASPSESTFENQTLKRFIDTQAIRYPSEQERTAGSGARARPRWLAVHQRYFSAQDTPQNVPK